MDLYCGAGGAAKGYHDAGFDVVGVDLAPQPNYPYAFHQADALDVLDSIQNGGHWLYTIGEPDAIHASPPCQHASSIAKQRRAMNPGRYHHPDLVPDTRHRLHASGLPYVIENVIGAQLHNPIQLCGSSFGLDVRRHRLFECSFPIMAMPCAHHWHTPRFRSLDKRRHNGSRLANVVGVHGHINYSGERELREQAMGIDWMTPYELTQAIPPAYTRHVGAYLLASLD